MAEFMNFIRGGKPEDSPNKLFFIIKNDDVEELSKIKDLPKDKEFIPSIYDNSPLVYCPSLLAACAYFHSMKCFDYLLKNGFDPAQKDTMSYSMAHYAGISGNFEAFEAIEKKQEGINEFAKAAIKGLQNETFEKLQNYGPFEDGETALHYAALFNNFELAEKLINEKKCTINDKDECDDLPQHIAARAGNTEALLVIAKDDSFDPFAMNLADRTIFALAKKFMHLDTLKVIVNDLHANDNKYYGKQEMVSVDKIKIIQKIISGYDISDDDIEAIEEKYSEDY
jgi:ankyrin repeat protein